MLATTFRFPSSAFVPIALGFFGLGTGYFVWGGQGLFGFPREDSPEVSRTMGMWGVWMPGFLQFLTGTYLLLGLTVFRVFGSGDGTTPLYMAAVAFTAYGVHWFALGHRRFIRANASPDGWMAIPFLALSALGAIVFFHVSDWPVGVLFVGLSLVYLTEVVARLGRVAAANRGVAFWQFVTGIWLMYLTYATVLNLALGFSWKL